SLSILDRRSPSAPASCSAPLVCTSLRNIPHSRIARCIRPWRDPHTAFIPILRRLLRHPIHRFHLSQDGPSFSTPTKLRKLKKVERSSIFLKNRKNPNRRCELMTQRPGGAFCITDRKLET